MDDIITVPEVTLSPRAAQQVNKVLSKELPGSFLRVAVNGGGCSGFQYEFAVVPSRDADDIVIQRDGATVLIDPVSIGFMIGSQIDFVDDLIGQSFKIANPECNRVVRMRHQLRALI